MWKPVKRVLNLRGLRAVAAVSMLVALVSVFFIDSRKQEELRLATLETAMGMNWRLNDVIVETLTTRSVADQLFLNIALSEVERSVLFKTLLLRYEILWSNVEIAQQTDLRNYAQFHTQLAALETYLQSVEDVMYAPDPPNRAFLETFGQEIVEKGAALQQAWQDTRYFSVQMFIGREEERFAQSEAFWRQSLVLILICLLTLYLLVEAYLAGNMRRSEARLKEEARSAAMASEAKSVFLANVSHEIRTPLNGILGMASELQDSDLTPDQSACLRVISHAGDVLLHTLNDVLDLSKVEAGQLELEKRVFDLHALLDAAIGLYRTQADAKHLILRLDRSPAVPQFVEGDGQRISQVLHNLIGNAIKFTEVGSVTVRATSGEVADVLRFSVIDTGEGIDPSVQDKVFEPFSQADGSITRTKGGTGLGLSISRGLCDAMGGYLALESHPGEGATFWFELPLPERRASGSRLPILPQESDPARRVDMLAGPQSVLIVDDNATNRLLLRRFMRDLSVEIAEAQDGAEAVEMALNRPFDVVLMDVQMPVMDGIAATEFLRAREAELGMPRMRIIAITANVMTHQIESYLQAGVDDVLGKPVAKADLLKRLQAQQQTAA